MNVRKLNRLKGYDYSQAGGYFVTISTHNRQELFGGVEDNTMIHNQAGAMVDVTLRVLPQHYPGVHIDVYVVMPNHVHAIVQLIKCVGACPYT